MAIILRVIKVFVSACLLGAPVRYDGRDKKSEHPVLQRWLDEGRVVSVCPEMLGGLGTPRPPAEIVDDRVVTRDGVDVTAALLRARGVRVFSEEQIDEADAYIAAAERDAF